MIKISTKIEARRRNGFTFLELLFGAAILAGAMIIFIGLVDASAKRVYDASARHLASLYVRNVTARYMHVRPNDLARAFGKGSNGAELVRRDPLIAATLASTPGTAASARTGGTSGSTNGAAGSGNGGTADAGVVYSSSSSSGWSGDGPATTIRYRPVPGQVGVGRLVTSVEYDTSRGPRELSIAHLVHGRKLPVLPKLSAEIAGGSSPVERGNAELARLMEKSPNDPLAQVVLAAMSLEQRHGRMLTPWASLVRGADSAAAALELIAKMPHGGEIPDGTYPVDWVRIGPLLTSGGRRSALTLYLVAQDDARYWVPVRTDEDGAQTQVWIGREPARDLGELALAKGRGESGVVAAEPGTMAHAFSTVTRVFALAPRLTETGGTREVDRSMTVGTYANPVGAPGATPQGNLASAMRGALEPSGLEFASSTGKELASTGK